MLTIEDYKSDGYDASKVLSQYDKYSKDEVRCSRYGKNGNTLPIFRSFIKRQFGVHTASNLFKKYAERYYEDKGCYTGMWKHFRDFVHTDFDLTFGYNKWEFLQQNKVIEELLYNGSYVKHLKIAMFEDLKR